MQLLRCFSDDVWAAPSERVGCYTSGREVYARLLRVEVCEVCGEFGRRSELALSVVSKEHTAGGFGHGRTDGARIGTSQKWLILR